LSIGAVGGVNALANIAGKDCVKLVETYKAGDMKAAMLL